MLPGGVSARGNYLKSRQSDATFLLQQRNIGHGLTWSELLRKFAKHNPEKERACQALPALSVPNFIPVSC